MKTTTVGANKRQRVARGAAEQTLQGNSRRNRQAEPVRPPSGNTPLTIGKVAKRAEVSVDTIRYYEREGLLSPTQKSDAGYRLYTEDALRRLNFIKHAQHCGLALSEIRALLELKGRDDACCHDVRALAVQKKLQIEHKVKALKAMSQALSELIEVCAGDRKPLDECPILSALEASQTQSHRKAVSND